MDKFEIYVNVITWFFVSYDPKSKAFIDDIYVEMYSCLFNVYVRQDCFSFHFYEEPVFSVLYYMQYF